MDFHQVIYPICSVFVTAPTLRVLARISYFKSRDLSESLIVIEGPIAGPKLWNSIPASLRNANSLNSFKKHLKDTFISPSLFLICK